MSWSYTIDELAVTLEAQRPGDPTRFSSVSTDSRTIAEGDVFFALSGPNFDGHAFVRDAFHKGAAAAVVEEEVPGGVCVLVPDTLEALQQFAAYHRNKCSATVIAITGSCGKTTSKDLIATLLETKYTVMKTPGNYNNEVGCPLSLLAIQPETERAVLELGANHPGEIARLCRMARPAESAITMIAEAHLEGFGSIEDVARAKAEIAEALPADGTFYINVDDPRCRRIAESFAGNHVRFGSQEHYPSQPGDGDVVIERCERTDHGDMVLTLNPVGTLRLPLFARAHAANVALAVAVGLRHGVTDFEAPLRAALAKATRFRIRTVGALTIIDDTYNANPASTLAAIEALAGWPTDGARVAVLGAMLELGPQSEALHRHVGEAAAESGVNYLIARGPDSDAIVEGAMGRGMARAAVMDDHEAIAQAVLDAASPGDVVLVKGSRGMRMEKVIEAMERAASIDETLKAGKD